MSDNVPNLRISMVTSADPRFPAENMIDGNTKSFWATTGLYPQEFMISFPGPYVVKKVTLWSSKVAGWAVSRTASDKKFDFDEIYSEDVDETPDSTLQVTSFTVTYSEQSPAAAAKHMKFTIRRGHDDFCAVYRVVILGEAAKERSRSERHQTSDSNDEGDDSADESRENLKDPRIVVVGKN
ncbi:Heat shock protein beta-11 [Entophlyctis luteolus]|nr:Heat shock protein beta-11 [Entophlyctis luteolus]KAJ3340152.1 Heat shock protein beta-11 [Entophlyctis luteolus]